MAGKRVAFLSEHASPLALLGSVDAGGQNVYVDEVSRHLADLGYQVDVFTRRDDPAQPEVVDLCRGVRIVHVPAGPPTWVFKDDLWKFMPLFRDGIVDFIEREAVTYDLIHSNFWMSGWVALQLKPIMNVPVVHIFHAMGRTKQRHQGDSDTSPDIRIAVESAVVQGVDRLIAQCPSEERELIDDYSADPCSVVVIPSAVNIETYRPVPVREARQAVGLDPEDMVVVYVGRLLPRKDVRNVVRGVAALLRRLENRAVSWPVKLMIVGGQTEEPDPVATPEIGCLQQLATELGMADRLLFTGKRQADVLRHYYSAGDVVVTTPWYEPFGLTPLEGMACGRPVIGSAVGGITSTIADGVTGFLVPPRDPEALAERLEVVLGDDDLRSSMGRAARRRVERFFTWRTVAQRTATVYETVTASHQDVEIARKGSDAFTIRKVPV